MSSTVQTSERFIDVPGGKVFAKCWTPLRVLGDPLLLMHDSLGCVDMWRGFPQSLAEKLNRSVVAYDRLGFGRSTPRQELPSVRFVNEEAELYLPAILKSFAVDTFAIFGHSVGGAMAVVSAGQFHKKCEAVVTESSQAFVEDRTKRGIQQAKADFENPKTFEKLAKYHGDKTKWVLDAWIQVWLSNEFANWSLKNDLPKMKCRVLAIHGDKDEYGSVKFPEMICDLAGGPSEKRIIENCGHVPHREQEDLILTLVSDFLRTR